MCLVFSAEFLAKESPQVGERKKVIRKKGFSLGTGVPQAIA